MAELEKPDYGLAEKLGFYQAGGGRPDPLDSFNKAFQTTSNVGTAYDQIIKNTLANKKASLENNKMQLGQNTVAQNFGGAANVPPAFAAYKDVPTDTAKEFAQTEGYMALGGLNKAKTTSTEQGTSLAGEKVWVNRTNPKDILTVAPAADKAANYLEFSKDKATGALLKGMMPAPGAIEPEQIESTIASVKAGKLAISQLPGFGMKSLKGMVIARMTQEDPTFSFLRNEADFQAMKDYTRYINSGGYQNTIKYLESIQPNLDRVVTLSDSLDKTQYPILNKAKLFAMGETGDVNTKAFAAAATEVADQLAKILQGGGTGSVTSDAKITQALDIFNKDFTPEQFAGVAKEMKGLLANRQSALESDTMRTLGMGAKTPAPAAIEKLPPEVESKVKNALGAPVTFGNGQTWHWDQKQNKSVRDK